MPTQQLKSHISQNRRAASKRMPRFSSLQIDASARGTGRRPIRTAPNARQAVEPTLCIEDAIRRFAETQPAQLYRGGA
ncbi:hypothetical protein [Thiorhodococcus fuscus]|uniref:Uncharacterized protein n=1 Tax=Thiorhodococcus fuscus TaxID=527200 RepID=A0ABW4Y7C4_9GAMM